MSVETAAVLEKAADVIRRNGLCKTSYYDEASNKPPADSPVDAQGAINIAVFGQPVVALSQEAIQGAGSVDAFRARQALRYHVGARILTSWNNAYGRTAEQVILALEGAARAEREATS